VRRRVALLLALLLLGADPASWAKKKRKKTASEKDAVELAAPLPGLHVTQLRGATRIDVVLPGDLIDFTVAEDEGGERVLYLLGGPPSVEEPGSRAVGEDEQPAVDLPPCLPAEDDRGLILYRADPAGTGDLEPLRQGLPSDGGAIVSIDHPAAGLILVRQGRIDVVEELSEENVGSSAGLRKIADAPDTSLGRFSPRIVRDPGESESGRLFMAGLGRLDYYAGDEDGGWGLRRAVPLPKEAARAGPGFLLSSPMPRWVGEGDGGVMLLATPPKPHGNRRLELLLIEPDSERDSATVRAWCRLPAPEELLSGDLVLLDGRAALVATTRRADKLSLFGERRIRVWYLEEDRSGSGVEPHFGVESRINLWQEAHPALLDTNGDGRDDLVFGYWKGLVKSRVVLDAYIRTSEGGFDPSPRTTAFNVKNGDENLLLYGDDLDGDGVADLVLRNEEELLVYRGLRSSNGANLVASDPVRRLPMDGDDPPRPRIVDLDGDGRSEIVLAREKGAQANLRIFRLDPPE
jgi:hypothetical protein